MPGCAGVTPFKGNATVPGTKNRSILLHLTTLQVAYSALMPIFAEMYASQQICLSLCVCGDKTSALYER